ncbi:MAG TPA: TonB-dependent receptor [Gammaproteobacteria bacterium]|nr:TonB-dependent receptor [Gammaproteobacteria bacterium]
MNANSTGIGPSSYSKLAAAVAAFCGGSVVLPAVAQEPTQAPAETVIVTGSYIERAADRPQPVIVLSGAEISLTQRQSLAETFKVMPQVQATSAIVNGNENFVSPTTNINLRGLGARATLVLMNGRRQTVDGSPGLDGVVSVDINNLAPSIMIERVEVLTDGASALYGSDAVAGVANLITRNGFEGIELETEMQSIDEVGSNDFTFGALFGSQGESTDIVAGFEWSSQERMNSEDRYSEERLASYGLTSTFANPGSFRPVDPTSGAVLGPNVPDPLCETDTITSGLAAGIVAPLPGPPGTGTGCIMSLSLGRAIVPESTQANGLAVVTHDLGNGVTAQAEIGFARARYEYDFGYGLPIIGNFIMPGENPAVAAAGFDTDVDYAVRYRIRSPLGDEPTNTRAEQDTYRFAGTLDGAIGDSGWNWAATATFSVNNTRNVGGDTIGDRFTAGLQGLGGPNCGAGDAPGVGDCFWYNPFANRFLAEPGDPNYNDPILASWIFARSNTEGEAELKTYDFLVTGEVGEIAGRPTGLAVGVQRREQSFFLDFDPITEAGGYAFNSTPQQDYGGIREADALFAEVVMFPNETVEIQLAARYEDYGNVDSTDPKIGLLWTPIEGLFLRATAGTSFRQPGEVQSFGTASQGGGSWFGVATNARGLLLGNENLQPEESENFTIGVTWDVTDAFTMDINYFAIDFENLIVTEDGTVIMQNDAADGFITDPRIELFPGAPNEVCEVTGNVGPQCISIDDIALLHLSYVNQDFMKTSGIDFNFNWSFTSDASDWNVVLNGTYVDKYTLTSENQVFEGAGSYNFDNFGYPHSDLLANLRLDWRRGDHHARATLRHIAALDNDQPENFGTEETGFQTLDLVYEYMLPSGRATITGAIVNATDEEDPINHGDLRTTTSFVYDLRGRMYRVGFHRGF